MTAYHPTARGLVRDLEDEMKPDPICQAAVGDPTLQ